MQKKNKLKKEKFYLSSTTKTQVIYPSKKFFHIWHNGPRNKENIPLLAQDIHTLGNTFLKFTRHPNKLKTFTKSHPQDLVTEIDQGIEALWRYWLTTFLPNDQIIGEEQENQALKENNVIHALIVHSDDGMDEISPLAKTNVIELKDGNIKNFYIDPKL